MPATDINPSRVIAELQAEIANQKRICAELMESRRLMNEAQRIARLGTWEFDLEQQTLRWSDEAFRIAGMTPRPDAPSFKEYLKIVHPEDRAALVANMKRLLADGKGYEQALRHLMPDGTCSHVVAKAETVFREGRPATLIGSLHDITEHKQSEAQTAKFISLQQATLESANDAILVVDPGNNWVLYNRRFVDMWHITDAIISAGNDDAALAYMLGQLRDADAFLKKVHALSATPEASSFDTLQFKDGRTVERNSLAQLIDGKVVGRVWNFRDITERRRIQDSLRNSEEKYRILLDESSDPIFSFYPDGQYRYVNKAFAKNLRLKAEDIIGKKIWDIFPEAEAEQRFEIVKYVFESGVSKEIEVRVPNPEGDLYFLTTVNPVLDAQCRVVSVICTSKNITERKHSEAQIEKFLSLLQATLESNKDAILVVDLNGAWVLHNQKFIDMWHITNEVIAARDDGIALSYMLAQLEDPAGFLNNMRGLYVTPEANSFDIHKFKDGRVIERSSTPQIIDGQLAGRVWGFRDVTEQMLTQAALRESEERFSLFMDKLPAAVFIKDENSATLYCNRYMEDIFGAREWLGKTVRDLFPQALAEKMIADDQRATEAGYMVKDELVPNADGEVRLYQTFKFAIPREGRPSLLGGIAIDMTEHKLTETKLQHAKETAERTLAEQRQFIAMISHEFRSPLAVIDSAAQLLGIHTTKERDVGPILARIRRGVARLTSFLDNCLTADRLDSESMALYPAHIDLYEFTASVKESAQQISENHPIVVELATGLPPFEADPQLLHILLLNLLGNAIKYSPAGSEVRLRIAHTGQTCSFEVIDRGRGIPADEISIIFKRYVRGRTVTSIPGAGLGLSLVSRITALHGGNIAVESSDGNGARITVTFPLHFTSDRGD